MNRLSLVVIMIILLLTSSCATILNTPEKKITIYTTKPSVISFNNTTTSTTKNKAKLTVERGIDDILIKVKTDSLAKYISVSSINSFHYYSNIYMNLGIRMIIDKDNPKRYSYPPRIYINSSDTTGKYFFHSQRRNKGNLILHLSLSYINSFLLKPQFETNKLNTGFGGLSCGFDYYIADNKFINLNATVVTDFFIPFPAPVNFSGEKEFMFSNYLSLSNNYKIKRLSFGYGISYSKNIWELKYFKSFDAPPPNKEPIKKTSYSFGAVFPTYFQMGNKFNIGLIYRPSFFKLKNEPEFEYEHLISIDFVWKIKLNK